MADHARSLNVFLVTVLIVVVVLVAAQMLFGQTPTPTPGPCDHCPDPGGYACAINYDYCVRCWEDCGSPIATPTPTVTPTPTATATPTSTPTPLPGPPCPFSVATIRNVYLVAVYAHEKDNCRYRYTTLARALLPGETARPGPYEGYPIGFEWHDGNNDDLLKSCGDTARNCTGPIFEDGFESGTTDAWSRTIGG